MKIYIVPKLPPDQRSNNLRESCFAEASSAFSQSNDILCPDSEMHGSLAAERAGKSVMTSLSPV